MDARQLIDELGGAAELARLLGRRPKAVTMWRLRNAIPAREQIRVWSIAAGRGVAWRPPGASAEMLTVFQREAA